MNDVVKLTGTIVGRFSLMCLVLTLVGCAKDTTVPDAVTMIKNLDSQMNNLFKMVTGLSYVIGMAMMVKAVYGLRVYGDLRTMSSSNTNLSGPLMSLALGTFFIYLPSSLHVMHQSFFDGISPMSYDTGDKDYDTVMKSVVHVLEFIGIVSFIRGWILLSKLQQGGQQGSLGKGVNHLVAGVLLINFNWTYAAFANTFGISFT